MNFNPELKHAVIGASNNIEKFGYKIFKHLKEKGLDVTPVNPHEKIILGLPVVKSIASLDKSSVLVFLIPPKFTFETVKSAINLGFKKFWFQPGSYDDEILRYCNNQGVEFSAGVCLLHK